VPAVSLPSSIPSDPSSPAPAPAHVGGDASAPVPAACGNRFDRIDAWRGLAIVWMALFHFSFDLNLYGWIEPRQVFHLDPFWTGQRTAIVSMFLLGAGAGQAVALSAGQSWPRFWRRWAQVAAGAALVSAGSALMFPRSWISFGVLHGMAVMLLLLRGLGQGLGLGRSSAGPSLPSWRVLAGLLGLAALMLWLPRHASHPVFDSRWLNGTGLVTHLPFTEDYVPVTPWLGVMLIGFVATNWALAHRRAWLAGPVPGLLKPVAVLGRWSLSFYLVHQPVLIGLVLAAGALTGHGVLR